MLKIKTYCYTRVFVSLFVSWMGRTILGHLSQKCCTNFQCGSLWCLEVERYFLPWPCLDRYCKYGNDDVVQNSYRFQRYDLIFHHNLCFAHFDFYLWVVSDNYHSRIGPAPDVTFFYTLSNLSALQSCALIFSTNFHFIFSFKYSTTQFSHWFVSCTKHNSIFSELFRKFVHSFVAIELIDFSKMQNYIFIARESSQYLGLNKSVRKQDSLFLLFVFIKSFAKNMLFCINENYNDCHQRNATCVLLFI